MITLRLRSRPAGPGDVDATLARLDHEPGAYFGCDAGVPGLHPSRAVAFAAPALALHLYTDGIAARALDDAGAQLLADAGLQAWADAAQRGRGLPLAQGLRRFMQRCTQLCTPPNGASDGGHSRIMLCGALPFDAWRLQARDHPSLAPLAASLPEPRDPVLGTLYLPLNWLERDADTWTHHELGLHGAPVTHSKPASLPAPAAGTVPTADDYPPGGHAGMVRRAMDHLADPALVSLTLSQSFRRPCSVSPAAAFARLRAVNPAPASFMFNDSRGSRLFGASPDLQLLVLGRTVDAMPVCGTVARRPGPVGEAESLRELLNEDVDAASLAVCTDALRWDLAPLCEPGTLHLTDRRRPMSLATVVHTVDRLRGTLREGIDAWDAIFATTAPAMVTGAPRARALAGIAALEASPRGWYGGLMVQVRADGQAMAGTILRAAWLRGAPGNTMAEVRTGGDLMADSSPEREEAESRLKAVSLWRALGLEQPPHAAGPPAQQGGTGTAAPCVTVVLQAAADPFEPALRDCVAALGMVVADTDSSAASGSQTVRLLGGLTPVAASKVGPIPGPLVAVGDAAAAVLRSHGFAVSPVTPRHGRLCMAHPTADPTADTPAALSRGGPFHVAVYETLALQPDPPGQPGQPTPPGWQTWLVGNEGQPLMLYSSVNRIACLLFRPESLLSAPPAREALRLALMHVQHVQP